MASDFWADRILDLMARGHTLEQSVEEMRQAPIPEELLEEAAAIVRVRCERVRKLRKPASISRIDRKEWYGGPRESDPCWPPLKRYLLEEKGWPTSVVDSVDAASTKVVSRLEPAGEAEFNTRGLVLGYVQSGKTANFTATIAKAADVGYRLFIVLAGMHNGLRAQTQERLEKELVQLRPELWHTLTTRDADFEPLGNATAFLADHASQRVLCVTKKNGPRLRKLLTWLRTASASVLATCPVLVIDDEADQASIDTADGEEHSAINGLILDLLGVFPKVGYVAYTATPFANILSDPSSREYLYPRDFIIDLPRPDDYYGAEKLFGLGDTDDEGLDVIRIVSDEETQWLSPASVKAREMFEARVTPALESASLWFWLASAVRVLRGHGTEHMTMLVHTSMLTDVHRQLREVLDEFRGDTLERLRTGDASLRERLDQLWRSEIDAARDEAPDAFVPSFDDVFESLEAVLDDCSVIAENATSQERLHYPEKRGSCQIVVGGNTLSRGLTLEGLMMSLFVRRSGMYDTLLQMGRWFGYRHGYEDLPRIWMTGELLDAFEHLALVESEIREHIARYEAEDLSPLDFAPHIRTHSTLAVTSPLKMRHAVQVGISFDEGVKQTTYFEHRDRAWLERNVEAARRLLKAADKLHPPERVWTHNVLYRDVPVDEVVEFLGEYQIHENHGDMRPESLREYIRAQNEDGRLNRWNVGVVSRAPGEGVATWSGLLPNGEQVALIDRARLTTPGPANLKAIMSKVDRALDFGFAEAPRRQPDGYESYVQWTRTWRSPNDDAAPDPSTGRQVPLLLLYPINPNSRPKGSKSRSPLDAVYNVVGLGIIFPRSTRLTPQSYVTADLARNREVDADLDLNAELGVTE